MEPLPPAVRDRRGVVKHVYHYLRAVDDAKTHGELVDDLGYSGAAIRRATADLSHDDLLEHRPHTDGRKTLYYVPDG